MIELNMLVIVAVSILAAGYGVRVSMKLMAQMWEDTTSYERGEMESDLLVAFAKGGTAALDSAKKSRTGGSLLWNESFRSSILIWASAISIGYTWGWEWAVAYYVATYILFLVAGNVYLQHLKKR